MVKKIYEGLLNLYHDDPFIVQFIKRLQHDSYLEHCIKYYEEQTGISMDDLSILFDPVYDNKPIANLLIARLSSLLEKKDPFNFIQDISALFYVLKIRIQVNKIGLLENTIDLYRNAKTIKRVTGKEVKNDKLEGTYKGFFKLDSLLEHYKRIKSYGLTDKPLIKAISYLKNENDKQSKWSAKNSLDLRQWHTFIHVYKDFKYVPSDKYDPVNQFFINNKLVTEKKAIIIYEDPNNCIYELTDNIKKLSQFYSILANYYPFTNKRLSVWQNEDEFNCTSFCLRGVLNSLVSEDKYKEVFLYLLNSPLK